MSNSPFISVLRSLNYTTIVSGLSDNLVSAYDSMKLPKMKTRMDSLNESLDKQIDCVKSIEEFDKSNKITNLDEMIKQIIDFSEQKYENREFKLEALNPIN